MNTYLTTEELAARWGGAVSVGTLANWRSKGRGPAYQKLGAKVRYPLAAVMAFEAENLHTQEQSNG
jgi:hypothetical protein